MRLLRHPLFRPVPALLLMLLALTLSLAFGGPEQRPGLRTLACWICLAGSASYWCTVLLERAGLLHFGGGPAMRAPSDAELSVLAFLLRAGSLLTAYLAPLLLCWA